MKPKSKKHRINLEQLDEFIVELTKIKNKEADDDYIILKDEDDGDRFEVQVRFC